MMIITGVEPELGMLSERVGSMHAHMHYVCVKCPKCSVHVVGRSVDVRGPVDHNSVGLAQAFLVRKHLSELLACNWNLHFPALFGE